MKILVIHSRRPTQNEETRTDYHQTFDSRYAEKVIANLVNRPDFCTSCGPECVGCRRLYDRSFGESLAGVIQLPAVLPYVLERPAQFVPDDMPAHDGLLLINIHEQILLEIIRRCRRWGTRGVIVPLESVEWVHGATITQARAICEAEGIEIAFPKPFCTFNPPAGSLLADFRAQFHIGYPDIDFVVRDRRIEKATVNVSAPCGATYYVARGIEGKHLDQNLVGDIASKRLSGYPCTARMEWDEESGDTVMHASWHSHFAVLEDRGIVEPRDHEPAVIRTPLGIVMPKPVPVQDNLKNIEDAGDAILHELDAEDDLSLEELRERVRFTPAAVNSALLILKKEGKIEKRGRGIVKV